MRGKVTGVALLFLLVCTFCFAAGQAEGGGAAATEAPAAAAAVQQPVTVALFHTYGEGSKKAARDDWFAAFEQKYPYIKLEKTRFSLTQTNQKLLAAVAAGTPPDLVSNHYYYFPRYASQGLLEPLEPYYAKAGLNPDSIFFPSALEVSSYQGTLYSASQFLYSRALIYNRGLFQKAGLDPNKPPETWDQLVEYAKRMTVWDGANLDTAGFGAPRIDEKEHLVTFFIMMVWQQGGDILSPDRSKITLATPEGIRALQYYADLFQKHRVSTPSFGAGTSNEQKPFARGKAGMIMGGNFDLVFMRQTAHDIDFGAAFLPRPQGGQYVSLVDSFNLALLRSSKVKEAAWKLIEFTSSVEAQASFSRLSFNFPARREAAEDPFFHSDPGLQVFSDSMNVGRAIPPVPAWSEAQDALASALEAALIGQKQPADALAEAEKKINSEVLSQ